MGYQGTIKNGVVVIEGKPALPEGSHVLVEVIDSPDSASLLGNKLLKYAGRAKGLPEDMAEHHDYYIHGTPKP